MSLKDKQLRYKAEIYHLVVVDLLHIKYKNEYFSRDETKPNVS